MRWMRQGCILAVWLFPAVLVAQQYFFTSLHATRQGKITWYGAQNGGFEGLAQVPIANLGCLKCHPGTLANGTQVDPATYQPGCNDCHDFAQGTTVPQQQCLKCHGRQGTEINTMQLSDVHRSAGLQCTSCHTKKDVHGDGTSYASLLEPGAIERQCEDCHTSLPGGTAHELHADKVDCRSCHMTTAISCYNCHFESLVQGQVRRAWGGVRGFTLLGKDPYTGKVRPATFMTMSYQGKTFFALAPYTTHSISADARTCSDCHGNANVEAYRSTGTIQIARWDSLQRRVVAAQGIVPIPPDWSSAFKFDFLTYNGDPAGTTDPSKWSLLKSTADGSQMLYLQPLGSEEMEALSQPMHDEFYTSLHATRQGKRTWYSAANGGFEALTGVPIEQLGCTECHASTYADGSPVDPATYKPECKDCHNFAAGYQVETTVCFGCHSRQGAEINTMKLSDVHRDRGMKCTSCHGSNDVHGNGTSYASMLEAGAIEKSCDDCHTSVPASISHTIHSSKVDCKACHLQTVITCYNCHLESQVQAHVKRAWGGLKDYVLLARDARTGKVTTATFMALSYQGKAFYAVAPYTSHSVVAQGRTCKDCHNNSTLQQYNLSGEIVLARWDEAQKKVVNTKGVIPVPPDWKRALKLDFLTYNGDPAGPTDPNQWAYLKTGADSAQMMYLQPLTTEQMQKLALPVGVSSELEATVPTELRLLPNYPNPFNPTTTVEFHLPKASVVSLYLYDLQGSVVARLLDGQKLQAGIHRLMIDAGSLPSGVYICRLRAEGTEKAIKLTLIR
ncbi:MAG: T9SS type A sorting domain-containing protein [candidate division KSB1 bacterium]|nr:T9SS type A sorting domain-containing protein [candidate division KSB1 bacterium]